MIEICALASGSNGNCYYVGNENEAVIIDAGIARRQLLRRMKEVKLDIRKVKAVFVTHEHADHIKGFRVISDMQFIPGYATNGTINNSRKEYLPSMIKTVSAGEIIQLDNITVYAIGKEHDAKEPISYRVEIGGVSVGVFTDLGESNEEVAFHVKHCRALFLEANYDHEMLMNGKYPPYLKQRVASNKGHLSNQQALDMVKDLKDSPLDTILLSHISKDNNSIDVALQAFDEVKDKYRLIATSRYEPTELIQLK